MHVLISAVSRFEKPSGVCRSAANLANCLVLHSDITKIYLVVGEWQVNYFQENFSLESDRIEVFPVTIQNSSLARNWWYMTGLPSLAKKLACSLVHLTFPIPIYSGLFSAKIVLTLNDLYPFEIPENFGYPQVYLNQVFARICLASCDGITCISAYTLQQLKTYFPGNNKPKEIIYISVDFEDKIPKQPSQLTESSSFLLTVAQHRKNKNLDILIKAFNRLIQTQKISNSTLLVLVGSPGPETNHLNQLTSELGLDNKVLFLSSLIDPELIWLYQHCKIMVLPSSVEGLGLPVIESLHFKSKVICSDIPTLREIGGEQCEYFNLEGDAVDNLMHTISKVYHDSARPNHQDMRFDKKVISNQYVAFYKGLLKI